MVSTDDFDTLVVPASPEEMTGRCQKQSYIMNTFTCTLNISNMTHTLTVYFECLQHALDLCTEHMEMHLNLTPGFLPVYSPLSHQFVRMVVWCA